MGAGRGRSPFVAGQRDAPPPERAAERPATRLGDGALRTEAQPAVWRWVAVMTAEFSVYDPSPVSLS